MATTNRQVSEFGDMIYITDSLLATHRFRAMYTEYKIPPALHSQEGIMSAYCLRKHFPIPTWHESTD